MNIMEEWEKFFSDAGIAASYATVYAQKFVDNEIQTYMLTELNDDYLNKMGIFIVGHVIAIRRHSKHICEEVKKTETAVAASDVQLFSNLRFRGVSGKNNIFRVVRFPSEKFYPPEDEIDNETVFIDEILVELKTCIEKYASEVKSELQKMLDAIHDTEAMLVTTNVCQLIDNESTY